MLAGPSGHLVLDLGPLGGLGPAQVRQGFLAAVRVADQVVLAVPGANQKPGLPGSLPVDAPGGAESGAGIIPGTAAGGTTMS
jgi:hypothetical protein